MRPVPRPFCCRFRPSERLLLQERKHPVAASLIHQYHEAIIGQLLYLHRLFAGEGMECVSGKEIGAIQAVAAGFPVIEGTDEGVPPVSIEGKMYFAEVNFQAVGAIGQPDGLPGPRQVGSAVRLAGYEPGHEEDPPIFTHKLSLQFYRPHIARISSQL